MPHIVTIDQKQKAKILSKKIKPMNLLNLDIKKMRELAKEMRIIMKRVDGVGLSANQIGLDMRFFVAEIPHEGKGRSKFYAILNPEIIRFSKTITLLDEGCLSIPDRFGPVERAEKITLIGNDIHGKKLKIKAWGFLARVFQHEVDHLNGILFTKRAKRVEKITRENS